MSQISLKKVKLSGHLTIDLINKMMKKKKIVYVFMANIIDLIVYIEN